MSEQEMDEAITRSTHRDSVGSHSSYTLGLPSKSSSPSVKVRQGEGNLSWTMKRFLEPASRQTSLSSEAELSQYFSSDVRSQSALYECTVMGSSDDDMLHNSTSCNRLLDDQTVLHSQAYKDCADGTSSLRESCSKPSVTLQQPMARQSSMGSSSSSVRSPLLRPAICYEDEPSDDDDDDDEEYVEPFHRLQCSITNGVRQHEDDSGIGVATSSLDVDDISQDGSSLESVEGGSNGADLSVLPVCYSEPGTSLGTRKESKRSPKLEHKAVTRVKSMMSIECPNLPQKAKTEDILTGAASPLPNASQKGRFQHNCKKGEPSELAGICTIDTVVLKRTESESFGLDLEIKSSPLKVIITGLRPGGAAEREAKGRMSVGDEIVAISGTPVCTSSYQEICDLMHNLPATLTLEIQKPVSAVDRLSSLIMSGYEDATKMEASSTPVEDTVSMDNILAAAEEDSSTNQVRLNQEDAAHSSDVPVSNIDDVITELNKCENDIKPESRPNSDITELGISADESGHLEEKENPSTGALQPASLDFSVLDSGNKACLLPVGKTFLNNYCRNYSQLLDENKEMSMKGCEEKPAMYNMLDDSDSESDSAADSAVKNAKSRGQDKDLQDTDTEEEIELCYGTVGRVQSNQEACGSFPHKQDISGKQTDKESIADKVPQKVFPLLHEMDSKMADLSTCATVVQSQVCPQSSDSDLSEIPKNKHSEDTPQVLLTSIETIENSLAAVSTNMPTCVNDELDTVTNQERTCKIYSDQMSISDRQINSEIPLGTEIKDSPLSSNSIDETSKTLTTNDKEIKSYPGPDCKANFSSSLGTLDNASLNSNVSSILNSNQKQDENLSTSTKLKGLSFKSKSKGYEEQVYKPGNPLNKTKQCSPVQSTKLTATRIDPTTSPKITRLLERCNASSIKASNQSHERSTSNISNYQKANDTDRSEQSTTVEKISHLGSEVITKSETSTRQRTFIEVRLSSSSQLASSSATPVLTCKQTLNMTHSEHFQGSLVVSNDDILHKELEPKPIFGTQVISLNGSVSRSEQSNCINNARPADRVNGNVCKLDATTAEPDNNKAGRSKPYLRTLDRRSYSTDGGNLDLNPFSVRQRIKSFENLASFDRPVLKCIDIHSYAVSSKNPLNRRSCGYTGVVSNHSVDNRSLKRSLSSCVDNLNVGPFSSVKPQHSSISKIINTSDAVSSIKSTGPPPEERPKTVPQSSLVPNTPPVLRSRNTRVSGGISRSKQRELRALSMPELDKLCPQKFSHDPGTVMFKTELEIHPTKHLLDNLQCTVVTRMSMVDSETPGSNENGEQAQEETVGHSSWSVSMKDLSSSVLNQKKLQDVLNNIKATADVITMMEEINSSSEVKDVYFVVLTKEVGSGLGFSIAGGVDLEQKSVTVHRVFNQGAAGLDGTIRRGDAVLSINGISLHGKTHGETLSCLHQTRLARQAVVVIQRGKDSELTSSRQEASIKPGPRLSQAYWDRNRVTETPVEVGPDGALSVELQKTSAGLGFSLEGGKAKGPGDRPLYIKRIFRGGAAELSQVIDVGDEVLAINDRSLQGLMHYDAWNIIKTVSEGPIRLIVRKPRTSV